MLLNVMECIDYKEKSDEMKNILRNNIKICLSKEESLLKRFKNYMNIKQEFLGGGNCTVIVGNNVNLFKVIIHTIGNNNKIVICDNCELHNCLLRTDGDNNLLFIGCGTYIGGATIHASHSTAIKIGKDCLLSHEIDIRSGEHCIYRLDDGRQYNFAKDISIGDHVWIGKRAQCLKGVNIANNSVIPGFSKT